MRVIREASSYRVACTKCKSLLEFKLDDVQKGHFNGYIRCPVCGCTVTVLSEKGESSFLLDNVTPIYNCEESSVHNCGN